MQARLYSVLATAALAAVLVSVAPGDANAQVGEWAFKRLNATHEALGKSDYKTAKFELDRMKERERKLNEREQGLMWQSYGHMYFSQSKYKPAAAAFEKSIALNSLDPAQILDMRFNLGQLYMAMESWPAAVRAFEAWLKGAQNPSPQASFIIGQAYIQTKQLSQALGHMTRACSGKKKPPESWLQTLGSVQYELKKKRDLVGTLKKLVEYYPKATYWIQLGGVYGELGDEKRSLAVYELAYNGGYLSKATHLKNLAQMFIYQNVPLKGAAVLETEIGKKTLPRDIDHLKILADAYVRAKELGKAVKPMASAAQMGKSGELYLRLAQLHLEDEKWAAAQQAATDAVNTGKLKDPGQAHMVSGVAAYYAGKTSTARKSLERAARSKNPTTANVARQWIGLLDTL